MSRLVPYKVDTFINRELGLEIPLMLDRNKFDFFANCGDNDIRSQTMEGLRDLVGQWAASSKELEWFPVIRIKVSKPWDDENGLSDGVQVELERFYLAKLKDPEKLYGDLIHHIKTNWDTTKERRVSAKMKGSWDSKNITRIPHKRVVAGGETIYHLHYTEELWTGLKNIAHKIGELRKQLVVLLNLPEGRDRIASSQYRALTGETGEING